MSYSLRRIVCAEEDSHIQISAGVATPTDVVADTLMFFKIYVANKLAPGRLSIQYAQGQYIKGI